jgi:small multidrug resistance pump
MDSKSISYLFLAIAILSEVAGSTFLQKSEQFTKLIPSIAVGVFYIIAFYCLTLALKEIPLGVAYGIWGSVGIALTALVGYFIFNQKLDLPAIIGISLMISGVIVVQVFSKSVSH